MCSNLCVYTFVETFMHKILECIFIQMVWPWPPLTSRAHKLLDTPHIYMCVRTQAPVTTMCIFVCMPIYILLILA